MASNGRQTDENELEENHEKPQSGLLRIPDEFWSVSPRYKSTALQLYQPAQSSE
jgi:hypothetical protein